MKRDKDKRYKADGFRAFAALNFCLSLVISAFFLLFSVWHPLGTAFSLVALVSNTVMLYAALVPLGRLVYALPGGRFFTGVLFGGFQLFMVTDLVVYKIFKFHMNSMVLNLVITPGGLESLDQGWGTKLLFLFAAAVAAGSQWYLWKWAGRLGISGLFRGKNALVLAGGLLMFVLADKGGYAWANLYDRVYITRNAQLFPFYQPLTIRKFARKHLGVSLDREVRGGIDTRYSGLEYPKAPLRVDAPGKPLNFLILVIDSLREDVLNPEVMPETWAFSRKSAVFRNHYSGGNCTRFGIFSLLYGIYGNYWFPMLEERRGPLFLKVLKEQGYDLRAYASAKLTFPEFNKTAFVELSRESIYDEPEGGNGIERDEDISERFISYLKNRDPQRSYFSFIFYDASHGNYDSLPGMERFQPAFPVSYLDVNPENIGGLFNRYRNSVYSDDHLAGRILKALKETGGFKDTAVLILGDHGEAFLEHGRFGHNQGYSPGEIRVPLVLYIPGRAASVIDYPTSHLDVVPTLMSLAGVRNPPSDYSNGVDLFVEAGRPYITSASWDTAAIITPERILEMPLEAYGGGLKVFDSEYRELGRKEAREMTPLIGVFQKEARRFMK